MCYDTSAIGWLTSWVTIKLVVVVKGIGSPDMTPFRTDFLVAQSAAIALKKEVPCSDYGLSKLLIRPIFFLVLFLP